MILSEVLDIFVHPRHVDECFLSISFMDLFMANPFPVANGDYFAFCVGSYLSFLDDSPAGHKPLRTFRRFRDMLMDDFCGVVKSNSELADRFLKSTREQYLVEFRRTPIFFEYMLWRKTGRTDLFAYILSFLTLNKKAKFERPDLADTALTQWLADECSLEAPLRDLDLLADLRSVMAYFLSGFEVGCNFKHGPGFTADIPNRDVFAKSAFALTPKIYRYLKSLPSPDPSRTLLSVLGHIVLDDRRPTNSAYRGFRNRTIHGAAFVSSDVPATLAFAFKSYRTMRSICMEPASHMFAQQNLLHSFYELFSRHEFLSRSIHIDNQEFNRRGALLGSRFHTLATIDLSSASDLVGLDLIRALMPRSVFRHLLATRSSRVRLPNGKVRRLLKMSPMGSAVCFPIQCLVFLSVVVVAELRDLQRRGLIENFPRTEDEVRHALRSIHRDWSQSDPVYYKDEFLTPLVYGDDIICDDKITSDVMDILRALRFRINNEKSFQGLDSVRESCGLYSYEGVDVTPFQIKVPLFFGRMHAVHTASITTVHKDLLERGYRHMANFMFAMWRWRVSLSADDSLPAFTSPSDLFFGRVERYNQDYQRLEVARLGVSDIGEPAGWYRSEAYQLFASYHKRGVAGASFSHSTRVSLSQRHRLVWEPA